MGLSFDIWVIIHTFTYFPTLLWCFPLSFAERPCPTPHPAFQEHESRRDGQGSLRGERSAAEGSGGDGAAAENCGEEELFTGRENCQPQQNSEELGVALLQPSVGDQVIAKLFRVSQPRALY